MAVNFHADEKSCHFDTDISEFNGVVEFSNRLNCFMTAQFSPFKTYDTYLEIEYKNLFNILIFLVTTKVMVLSYQFSFLNCQKLEAKKMSSMS